VLKRLKVNKLQEGFTLLEVILVVFLITIVTAAVLPSFSNILSKDISGDSKTVASIIRLLIDDSGATGTTLPMVVDLDGQIIHYIREGREEMKKVDTLYSIETPSYGMKENGEVKLEFQPSGFSEYMKVRLSNGERTMDVIYNPYTGRVMIKEVTEEEIKEEERERDKRRRSE